MSTRALAALALCTVLAGGAAAQPVLTIEEWDENGRAHPVEGPAAVVDVNSLLRIDIDRARLRALMLEEGDADTLDRYLDRARRLTDAAQKGLASTRPLAAALDAYRERPDAAAVEVLTQALRASATTALGIVEPIAEEGGRWEAALDDRLEAIDPGDPRATEQTYAAVFDIALEQARWINDQADSVLAARGGYVRMAAWMTGPEGQQPVHLEGFDRLPRGEYVRVNRFGLALTAEQQERLAAYRRLSGLTLRQAADSLARWTGVGGVVRETLTSGLGEAHACAAGVERLLDGAVDRSAALAPRLDALRDDLAAFAALLERARADYRALSAADLARPGFAAGVLGDLGRVATQVLAMRDALASLRATAPSLGADLAGAIAGEADACTAVLERAATAISSVRALLTGAAGARSIAAESFEMTDAILKLSVERVPERVDLWLTQTGARAAGDVLVLRMVVGGDGAGETEREVEHRQLTLQRVLPHLVMAPALVFAYRASGVEREGRFQAAPSYSILLKRGYRNRPFVQGILSPGIGLNVATLDFDNDDDLEIGFGVVLSLFRDSVQGGYGFNVQDKTGYPYFGVNLPLTTVNVGL